MISLKLTSVDAKSKLALAKNPSLVRKRNTSSTLALSLLKMERNSLSVDLMVTSLYLTLRPMSLRSSLQVT